MIAFLKGRIIYRDAEKSLVILDVNGVGYEVLTPFSGAGGLYARNGYTGFFIYTYVREDRITLYGFDTTLQKDIFSLLLDVKDVGPKLAVTILSRMSAENIVDALTSQDVSALCSIKGIGAAKAERIVMELKNKIAKKIPFSGEVKASDICSDDPPVQGFIESPARKSGREPVSGNSIAEHPDAGFSKEPKKPHLQQHSEKIIESAGALEALGYPRIDSFNVASRVFGIMKEKEDIPSSTEDLTKECLKYIYSIKSGHDGKKSG